MTDLSITIAKDEQQLLPIEPTEQIVLFSADIHQASAADEQQLPTTSFNHYLGQYSKNITEVPLSEAANAANLCYEADKIIIVSNNALHHSEQRQQIQAITNAYGNKTIAIATHSPYDYIAYKNVSTYIMTYDPRPITMEATSRFVIGQYTNRARLPITLDKTNRKLRVGYRYKKPKNK